MTRLGFCFDMTACIGCGGCQVVCQDQHGLAADIMPRHFDFHRHVGTSTGHYPYSGACHHCARPGCLEACPTGAIAKAADGTVQVDPARCVGCGVCVRGCPYGAVALDPVRHSAVKCDACTGRRAQGLEPACVAGCPTGALRFGELEAIAPTDAVSTLPNLPSDTLTGPSLRVRVPQGLRDSVPGESVTVSPDLSAERTGSGAAAGPQRPSGPAAMRARRLACRLLGQFFCDREGWARSASLLGVEPGLDAQAYGDLFYGTDASVQVPLWASVCIGPGRVFLNETTLELIRHCKALGYRPRRVDGNPPDFIGEQLHYLEYLAACGLEEDFFDFVERFARPTFAAMARALRTHSDHPEVLTVCKRLGELLDGGVYPFPEEAYDGLEAVEQGPPIPLSPRRVVHSAGVNNCGGRCCVDVVEQEGCILCLDSRPEPEGPAVTSCPRGKGYRQTFLNTDRLRYPMKRVGKRGEGKFRRISWEEAVAEVAAQTRRIREQYGPGARHVLYGTGVSAAMRGNRMISRLLHLDGGALGSYNSYSSACASYVTPYIYGDNTAGNSAEDVLGAKLLILWGHNPAETQFGSERNRFILEAKAKGLRVVVIDPRCSNSAVAFADEWVPIRPSTDGAMADAMAWVIWSRGLQDQNFMDRFCVGFDEAHMPPDAPPEECVRAYLFGERDGVVKTPQWAEAITGVPAATIERLAVEYATAKPASLQPGLGLQRTVNGEQTVRCLSMLACLTGNVGKPGGGAAASGWTGGHAQAVFPVPPNPYPGLIPCFLWFRAVDRGLDMRPAADGLKGVERLESPVKALYCMNSNTLINQHSNINETMAILSDESKCEFIVAADVFMTPSARWADLLLPAPSLFECDNIGNPWASGYGNYMLAVNRAIEPLFGSRFEYDWMAEAAKLLGIGDAFTEGRDTQGWLEHIYDTVRAAEPELPDYAVFRARGGHRYAETPPFVAYRENIEGGRPFATPSGKIEIFSRRLWQMGNSEEIPGIPRYTPCVEGPEDPLTARFPLQLIGYHTVRRTHSVHDNNELLDRLDPPALWLHPQDAAPRGIADGEPVEVYNDRGRVRLPAKVTDRVMPGVVAMSQGGWYRPDADGVDRRGSINVLTLTHKPSPLAKGNPQHTNLVAVRRAD